MKIYIHPSHDIFLNNKIFDLSDVNLNRDDQLVPYVRAKKELEENLYLINTADNFFTKENLIEQNPYVSFGSLFNYKNIKNIESFNLRSIALLEPPLIAPKLYQNLNLYLRIFKNVYVHNTTLSNFNIDNRFRYKLKKLYWPMPYKKVNKNLWEKKNRKNKLVIINSYQKPKNKFNELYSFRLKSIIELGAHEFIDLFGKNWSNLTSRNKLWLFFLKNRKNILSNYHGSVESKYQTLSLYNFALCIENTRFNGYISEKLFDAMYVGTIPIYYGAPDINQYLPRNTFINFNDFKNINSLVKFIKSLNYKEIQNFKESGREFIESSNFERYYNSISNIINAK